MLLIHIQMPNKLVGHARQCPLPPKTAAPSVFPGACHLSSFLYPFLCPDLPFKFFKWPLPAPSFDLPSHFVLSVTIGKILKSAVVRFTICIAKVIVN